MNEVFTKTQFGEVYGMIMAGRGLGEITAAGYTQREIQAVCKIPVLAATDMDFVSRFRALGESEAGEDEIMPTTYVIPGIALEPDQSREAQTVEDLMTAEGEIDYIALRYYTIALFAGLAENQLTTNPHFQNFHEMLKEVRQADEGFFTATKLGIEIVTGAIELAELYDDDAQAEIAINSLPALYFIARQNATGKGNSNEISNVIFGKRLEVLWELKMEKILTDTPTAWLKKMGERYVERFNYSAPETLAFLQRLIFDLEVAEAAADPDLEFIRESKSQIAAIFLSNSEHVYSYPINNNSAEFAEALAGEEGAEELISKLQSGSLVKMIKGDESVVIKPKALKYDPIAKEMTIRRTQAEMRGAPMNTPVIWLGYSRNDELLWQVENTGRTIMCSGMRTRDLHSSGQVELPEELDINNGTFDTISLAMAYELWLIGKIKEKRSGQQS